MKRNKKKKYVERMEFYSHYFDVCLFFLRKKNNFIDLN